MITLLKSIQGKAVRGGSKPWVSTPNVCNKSRPCGHNDYDDDHDKNNCNGDDGSGYKQSCD